MADDGVKSPYQPVIEETLACRPMSENDVNTQGGVAVMGDVLVWSSEYSDVQHACKIGFATLLYPSCINFSAAI